MLSFDKHSHPVSAPILIVGSTNTDMVIRTPALPSPGQTVIGHQFNINSGGKGANQAVAAARLGGSVAFITRIGNDSFGANALEQLQNEHIDCRYIGIDPEAPSGVALITVDNNGENTIAVAPGANAHLHPHHLLPARDAIHDAKIILTQLEIPLPTVEKLIGLAAEAGKRVILNPAPAQPLSNDLLSQLFVLTPNALEATLLTATPTPVRDFPSAEQAARDLSTRGVPFVIITLGSQGCLVFDGITATPIPAPEVTVVDTTAAGDVFNGALAVALSEGMGVIEAATFATHAAALSVTRPGAQSAAPTHAETAAFIEQVRSTAP
jgi:ribokinase